MNKFKKNHYVLIAFFLALSSTVLADPFDEPEIDPPPPTPIDNSLLVLFLAGVLFAAYFFYKKNLKIEKK
jgi:hypothetical protein